MSCVPLVVDRNASMTVMKKERNWPVYRPEDSECCLQLYFTDVAIDSVDSPRLQKRGSIHPYATWFRRSRE